MLRKIVGTGLVGLFLVVSFVVAEDSIGAYNPVADVNRDGMVDILDLVEVGQAYGSNYTLMSIPNKTVVTVLSFEKEPPEVEGALVSIYIGFRNQPANFTNSSGVAVFDLSPDSSYTAVAFSGAAYNYINFTTNPQGEANVLIMLGEPSMPIVRRLPEKWLVFTFRDNVTGDFYDEYQMFSLQAFMLRYSGASENPYSICAEWEVYFAAGDLVSPCTRIEPTWIGTSYPYNFHANHTYVFRVLNYPEENKVIGYGAFQLDADYSAHAIVYGNSSA